MKQFNINTKKILKKETFIYHICYTNTYDKRKHM